MDTIVTPVTVITLDSTRIVHSIKADLVARYFPPVVRLVQYDMSLPVIAVSLMHNGQTYTLPSGAAANIRVHKPDATYVYNPALGCDSTRNIVYFEVTQAMAAANGDGLAIVEIVVNGDIAGTSLITLHFEENPVPEDAIESSDEWETIYELGERIIASTVTPVSTAAGMTDHNVVYLYTGTESGWNQGHMYYYNGTTWVDAGIAVTDITLSVAGLAADAKKTGDEIADLKDGLQAVEDDVADVKDDLIKNETLEIPCSFSTTTDKASLTLSDYSGKKVFISNKNLLPQFTQMTDHGVTCTKNSDGSISLSGTASGAAVIPITVNEMPNLGPGTYALSCGNSVAFGDSNTYINVGINGSYAAIYARFNAVDGKTVFTIPEGSRLTEIRIRISSGVSVPESFKCYPQITEGSEFVDFVAHEGTVFSPTSAQIDNINVYPQYTYICAQSGVTGTVTYGSSVIDDLDARVTVLEGKTGKFTGKKIVCFGDSIVGNFPAPSDYPSMIAEITGATVYNAGFGGCCMCDSGDTADQPRRLFTMCRLVDSIVAGDFSAQRNSGVSITYAGTSVDYVPDRLTMLEGIDWSSIDYITIGYGTNDWNSNYGLDNDQNSLDTTTYVGAFRYSVEKLLATYPNIKILVITPLWRWWDTNTGMPSEIHSDYIDSNDYAKGTGYKLWQYGDALADAAKLYHIPTFNLYWNCMMTKQNRLQYFNYNDGTHPKLEGRELMAELISAHLGSVY